MIFAKRRGALIGIAIAFLIAVAVAVIVHHPHSAPNSPEGLLLKADQMAWGNNWPGAAPYYAQAEVLFKNRHDSRHALYARVSQIPVRTQNTEQLTLLHEVDTYLRLPEAADPEIRLRILTIRGIVENNYDSLLASKTWAEVEKLAVQQHKFYLAARAHGEEGIGAFLAGNVSEARSHVLQAYFVAKYLHDPAALVRYASLYGAGRVQLGLYESGLEALDEAIRVAKNNPDIAFPMIAYNYKISALAGLGRYQEGLAIAQEGLAHLRQLGDVKGYLYGILTSRGQLYMNQKNWPAAIDDFGTAVSCAKQIGFWIGLMEGDSFLAQAYEGAGQLPKALAAIDEALEANKRIPDETYFLPGNLAIKARIQSELGQIADASTSYEEGQAIAITMLRTARTRDIERTVLVQLSDLYAGNFALLCKVQRYPQAFHVIETERGRLEAESLQEPRRPESLHLPAIAEQQVMHQVMQQQFRVVDAESSSVREHLLQEIADTQKSLDSYSPAPNVTVKTSDLASVQSSLRPNELLIEYVLYSPSSYALALTNTSVHVYTLPDKRILESQANAYREEIQDKKTDNKTAHTLFENLLRPVHEYAAATSIIVVPDGALHLLPFSALVDDSGSYLIRAHAISAAPSGTVLEILHRNRRPLTSIPFLGIAPFSEKASDMKLWVLRGASRDLPPLLPESRGEVEDIAKMFPKSESADLPKVLIGPDATKAKLYRLPLDKYGVIHLATHAYVDPKFPGRSAVLLAAGHSTDDSRLQLREIKELNLNTDLVTLSACDTGVGPADEVGIISIVDAFIEAGAKTVVSTLWHVDDASSAGLMKQFYANLSNAQEKEQALRHAQLALLKSGALPYYWASFSMVGDPDGTIYRTRIANVPHPL